MTGGSLTTEPGCQMEFHPRRIFSDKRCTGGPGYARLWGFSFFLTAVFFIQPNLVKCFSIDETANMNTAEVLKYYGYPAETHQVQTVDGYILTLHRIPRVSKKPPVLILHGILDSSFTWVLSGPDTALAFQLFKNGYDVWLGNFRGNHYSRGHSHLTSNENEYWNFSWDEMGKRDLPAMVDYVIYQTKKPKIFHIGHSMGTTTFFVLTSSMPAYNKKFVAHFALSPVGYWGNSASFFWKILAPVETPLSCGQLSHPDYKGYRKVTSQQTSGGIYLLVCNSQQANKMDYMYRTNHGGFLIDEDAESLQQFCRLNGNTARLCKLFIHCSFGFSNVLKNESIYEVFSGHAPAGTSIKSFNHYSQLLKSGRFRNYDYYDHKKNYLVYGSVKPPDYNISRITAPVSFHYAANDAVSVPADVLRLYRQLKNPLGLHLVQDRFFNHIDFTIDPNANKLLYKRILKMMKSLIS